MCERDIVRNVIHIVKTAGTPLTDWRVGVWALKSSTVKQ